MSSITRPTVSSCWPVLTALLVGTGLAFSAEDSPGYLPDPVGPSDFRHVSENSPFTRPLNLSNSLRLAAVAKINGKPIATVMDEKTKEIFVITEDPNPSGWTLVDVDAQGGLEKMTATISVAGSEVATVRFGEQQLNPKGNPKVIASMKLNAAKQRSLPQGYNPKSHQPYVDARMRHLSNEQKKRIHDLWQAKQKAEPKMQDRGQQFVRIMEFVAGGER